MPINQLPEWLDFSSWQMKGIKLAEKYTLPDDVRICVVPKNSTVNINDSIGRGGVQYFRKDEYPLQNRMYWFESKNIGPENYSVPYFGETYPPSHWAGVASSQPAFGTIINEFLEGGFNVRQESEQYRAWARALWERMQSLGIANPEIYISYGAFIMYSCRGWQDSNGGQKQPTDAMFKNLYANQAAAKAAWPAFFQDFGGGYSHDKFNLPNKKFYSEGPYVAEYVYQIFHELEIMCLSMGPGARVAYVSSGLIESLPDTVPDNRPGWDTHIDIEISHRVSNPPGDWKGIGHPDWDWNAQLALYFGAMAGRGRRVISWADTTQFGENPDIMLQVQQGSAYISRFEPDIAGQQGQFTTTSKDAYPVERLNWIDAIYAASHKYRQSFRTEGETWRYVDYKKGSGSFIGTQPDGSDILFHAQEQRGIARGRQKGNFFDWEYYNPNLLPDKDSFETITLKSPSGAQFTYELQGGIHHSGTETI